MAGIVEVVIGSEGYLIVGTHEDVTERLRAVLHSGGGASDEFSASRITGPVSHSEAIGKLIVNQVQSVWISPNAG